MTTSLAKQVMNCIEGLKRAGFEEAHAANQGTDEALVEAHMPFGMDEALIEKLEKRGAAKTLREHRWVPNKASTVPGDQLWYEAGFAHGARFEICVNVESGNSSIVVTVPFGSAGEENAETYRTVDWARERARTIMRTAQEMEGSFLGVVESL